MFKVGDKVYIQFTGKEYDAYIPHGHIHAMMRKNPHKIRTCRTNFHSEPRFCLEGDRYHWPPCLLAPVKEGSPDWKV